MKVKLSDTDVEGYVSFKAYNKDEKNALKKNLVVDSDYSFIVQQIDYEVKLIILSFNDDSIVSSEIENKSSEESS